MTKEQSRLKDLTDKAILELVYPKYDLQKAYNYYHGKMDAEQYRYLEENYGIGLSTKVEFIPLVKKHIDALIGEYLGTPIIPKVSCKDKDTISNIEREKKLKITSEVYKFLLLKLKNQILQFIDGKDITDKYIDSLLKKLIDDLESNFTSDYEIASLNVILYIMQSRQTDMITKLKMLFLDILITGYCFYKVKKSSNGSNVNIDVISPLNAFIDRNPESPYVKDSYRAVVRKWKTQSLILNDYGRDLSLDDIAIIKNEWNDYSDDYSSYYIRNAEHSGVPASSGLYAGEEVVPGYPVGDRMHRFNKLIPVYEVEWIETDKNFVLNRFETIRIGDDIYILHGKDKEVIRSKDNPDLCSLRLNGVYFLNRSAEPYSLMIACEPLLDKYTLLHYFRDSIIANSGTIGDYVDMSLLPTWLGHGPAERLQKYIAYKKTGIAPIDTAQEGRLSTGQAPLTTIFNGYDDTVKAQAIQAILLAIESVELTCSSITGVFRERLNGIEQRDAVSNIKMGANNSFIITKQYYLQMDVITNEILLDMLNVAKVVYKNGLTGTIILGDKFQKTFTALPEHYTLSDHDIHIITSTDVMREMELIKLLVPDFIKSGSFTPDIIFEAMTSKSLTDLKQKVRIAMAKQKEENNLLLQLQLLNELLLQLLLLVQGEMLKALKKIEELNESRIQLENEKLKMQYKIDMYNAKTDRDYKENQSENNNKRTEIELLQLRDGNPYNDEVRNI